MIRSGAERAKAYRDRKRKDGLTGSLPVIGARTTELCRRYLVTNELQGATAQRCAEALGMTRTTLYAHLRSQGMSFPKMVREVRKNCGMDMLDIGYTLEEIAEAWGYQHTRCASREWAAIYGETFRESRERMANV